MTRYSLQPRDWIFLKGYGYLSFAKLLDHAKQSTTDAFKTASKRVIEKKSRIN